MSYKFESKEDEYIVARWLYSIGKEWLDDFEYNALHREIETLNLLPEYTTRSWSSDPCPLELLKKYGMEEFAYEIRLCDKTESIPSIVDESELEAYYKNKQGTFIVSMKENGWSTNQTFYNKEFVQEMTRGRSSDALDLSHIKHRIKTIGLDGELKIIGEREVSRSAFEELKRVTGKSLVSQRASVISALCNDDTAYLASFCAFDIFREHSDEEELSASMIFYYLEKWGFRVPLYRVAKNGEDVIRCIKELETAAETYPYPTDGIVVRSDIGRDLRAIRVGRWAEKIHYSWIIGIEETPNVVSFGTKLLIEPTDIGQQTQRRIDITNVARIRDFGLFENTPVAFTLRSDASAQVDLKTTLELQKVWKGRFEEYKNYITLMNEKNRRK